MNPGKNGKTIRYPENLHKEWKTSGAFDNGIAIVLGKVWHNPQKEDLYLIGIDWIMEKRLKRSVIAMTKYLIITIISMDPG